MTYDEFLREHNRLDLLRAMHVGNKRKYKSYTAQQAALAAAHPEHLAELVAYGDRMHQAMLDANRRTAP